MELRIFDFAGSLWKINNCGSWQIFFPNNYLQEYKVWFLCQYVIICQYALTVRVFSMGLQIISCIKNWMQKAKETIIWHSETNKKIIKIKRKIEDYITLKEHAAWILNVNWAGIIQIIGGTDSI